MLVFYMVIPQAAQGRVPAVLVVRSSSSSSSSSSSVLQVAGRALLGIVLGTYVQIMQLNKHPLKALAPKN